MRGHQPVKSARGLRSGVRVVRHATDKEERVSTGGAPSLRRSGRSAHLRSAFPAPCPALAALVAGFTAQIVQLEATVAASEAGRVRAEGAFDGRLALIGKLRITPQLTE